MLNIDPKIHSQKAVTSHDKNAPLFANRYAQMASDPYANAFIYGRKKMFEWLFDWLKKNAPAPAKILDAGCGTGYLLSGLAAKGYEGIGVEPSAIMREQAAINHPHIRIRPGSITKFDWPDNSFDSCFAIEVFRYLSAADRRNGYAECLRVLKPGGYLIVSLVNRYALDGFLFLYYGRYWAEKIFKIPMDNYCDFVTPAGIKKYFRTEFGETAETKAVLFSPLRLIYKINPRLGRRAAKALEKFDEYLSRQNWWQPFAGHLIVIVRKK